MQKFSPLRINNSLKNFGIDDHRVQSLYQKISGHIDLARVTVRKTVDSEMVKAYWLMGRDIVEEEQYGAERAGYGQAILQSLSERLLKKYGRGFSTDTLERARKFYLVYQDSQGLQEISAPAVRKLEVPSFSPNLSWAHYFFIK